MQKKRKVRNCAAEVYFYTAYGCVATGENRTVSLLGLGEQVDRSSNSGFAVSIFPSFPLRVALRSSASCTQTLQNKPWARGVSCS